MARCGARGGSHLRSAARADALLLGLVVVVALALPFVSSGFQTLEFAYALIFAMAILGLNILTGFSGQTVNRTGWTAGAGIEYAFQPNWSAKVEYLHYGLSSATYFGSLGGIDSGKVGVDTIKIGINYLFH